MVGAAREPRQMIQGYDPNLLRDFCAKTGTQWIFTTAAPHQNGRAEALVKSCKRAIKNAIREQVLSPFELYTFHDFPVIVFSVIINCISDRINLESLHAYNKD